LKKILNPKTADIDFFWLLV